MSRYDEYFSDDIKGGHGKKDNQKLKPYIVLQYLLRNTDENNVASAALIAEYLKELGIYAERRSIYKDIKAINKVFYALENDTTIQEAEEVLAEDEYDTDKTVVYDKSKKGFYVRQRHFDLADIRLLAECVYSAKFLDEGQSKRLADIICEFVSENQAELIRHDAFLTDRVKTDNKSVLSNIDTINTAMSTTFEGAPHTPEKVSFKYLQYSIKDMKQRIERRHGEKYIVSPYKLLINDGDYYLLAFDDASQEIRTYRVDRMKSVTRIAAAREGRNAFAAIELRTYTQRVFSMFGGTEQQVSMHFDNSLLDAVADRFGTRGLSYRQVDNNHFSLTAQVEISISFFSWLCGFGNKAQIIAPATVKEQFINYLDSIQKMYKAE